MPPVTIDTYTIKAIKCFQVLTRTADADVNIDEGEGES